MVLILEKYMRQAMVSFLCIFYQRKVQNSIYTSFFFLIMVYFFNTNVKANPLYPRN